LNALLDLMANIFAYEISVGLSKSLTTFLLFLLSRLTNCEKFLYLDLLPSVMSIAADNRHVC